MNSLFMRRLTVILVGIVIILIFAITAKFVVLNVKNATADRSIETSEVANKPEITDENESIAVNENNEEVDFWEEPSPTLPPVIETEAETETEPEIDLKTLDYESVSFFMESLMERYESYAQNNPSLSAEEVVMKVNMNLDYHFYTNIVEIDVPDDLLVLCNKFNQLPSDFTPHNLAEVPLGYHVNDGKTYNLDLEALNAFIEMSNQAGDEGISLKIISAYRTNEFQAYLYNKYKTNNGEINADRYSARPGHSEHETGLAIDINDVSQAFENTNAFDWLQDNAHEYGYILRYPKNMEMITGYMYEPWHYRYVGVETAIKIKSEELTFDAYYAMYILPDKNR